MTDDRRRARWARTAAFFGRRYSFSALATTYQHSTKMLRAEPHRIVKQRLSIHIGAIKTGSSAIQWFLKDNSERLRAGGIVVPDQQLALTGPITGDHIPFFDARRDGRDDEYRSELTARVDALFRETGARQIVISAENLSEGDTQPAP